MTSYIVPGMPELNEGFETFNCCPYMTKSYVREGRKIYDSCTRERENTVLLRFYGREKSLPHIPFQVEAVLTTCENDRNNDLVRTCYSSHFAMKTVTIPQQHFLLSTLCLNVVVRVRITWRNGT